MHITLLQYLIICPMVLIAGIVDAVAGGGGLISLPVYMIVGLPPVNAIATNKTAACMGTAMATWRYIRSGYVVWSIALCGVATAIAGSCLGARLALLLSDRIFKIVMLVILPLTGGYVIFGHSLEREREPYPVSRTCLLAAAVSFFIGIYDGFYGPGTGVFLILLLTAAAHLDLKKANGITKVINLSTNVGALAVYLYNGKSFLMLGIIAGLFNIAGNYLGTRLFDKGGHRFVRPLMICVLVIFFVKVLLELTGIL